MSLAVAIQMDPIEAIDIQGDSSFVLALEAQRRGHGLFHYLPSALSLKDGRVYARMQPLEVRREAGNHFTLGTPQTIDLATLDVVLMRQDQIGRAHVCTPVTNAHLVCRLLLDKKKTYHKY